MTCPDENAILEYLEGTLEARSNREIEAHLDSCALCVALVAGVMRASHSTITEPPGTFPGEPAIDLVEGSVVDHFVVRRFLGQGATGAVYLCRDTKLGRRVALKVVRPDALATPSAVARFLHEARTIARFSHPNIVTLHEVGQWNEFPYLVLDYVEGETLRERIAQERPGVRQAIRIALAIAKALREAHRNDVLHGDLKPANILIPKDGQLRVVDFGLARVDLAEGALADDGNSATASADDHGTARGLGSKRVCGTPAYMAPEQWRAAEVGAAVDIWALGVIIYELLSGKRPYHAPDMASLKSAILAPSKVPSFDSESPVSTEMSQLLFRCLEKDADKRPLANELVSRLEAMLVQQPSLGHEENLPYRGLRAFTEQHASFFFGRESETTALVEEMRTQGVVAIVGASGAGKSSFVQAGLIPRLRDSATWCVLKMRPGADAFLQLATTLLRDAAKGSSSSSRQGLPRARQPSFGGADCDAQSLANRMRAEPRRLNLILREIAASRRCKVLLYVDQLEELCTMAANDGDRLLFMESLCAAGDDPADPVRIVFSLRDDFLGRLAVSAEVRAALGRVTILHDPQKEVLLETITKPLALCGYAFDDSDLANEMISAVSGESAALPLLQFTVQKLWDRRNKEDRLLERGEYERLGGVAGALATHADGVIGALPQQEVSIARRLLLRLANPDKTRRTISRRLLLQGLPETAEGILDALIGGRLLVLGRRPGTGDSSGDESSVELVHESLIKNWHQLSAWVDAASGNLKFLSEINKAAEIWEDRNRADAYLWRGQALAAASQQARDCLSDLTDVVRGFLARSEEVAILQRRRRQMKIGASFVLLALVAVGAVIAALTLAQQKKLAAARSAVALRSEASAQRGGAAAAIQQRNLVEGRAKIRRAMEIEDDLYARALWQQLDTQPLLMQIKNVHSVLGIGFASDGRSLVLNRGLSVVHIDGLTSKTTRMNGHDATVTAVAPHPRKRLAASGGVGGRVLIWNLEAKKSRLLKKRGRAVEQLRFSSDGKSLAASFSGGEIRVWQAPYQGDGRVLPTGVGRAPHIEFSPDGQQLVSSGRPGEATIWDIAKMQKVRSLGGFKARVDDISWSKRGGRIAAALPKGAVVVWNANDPAPLYRFPAHNGGSMRLAFRPGKNELLTASSVGQLRMWIVGPQSATLAFSYQGHNTSIPRVNFNAPGDRLVTTDSEETVAVWNVGSLVKAGGTGSLLGGSNGYTTGVAVSPTGHRIAAGSSDGAVYVWDADSGRLRHRLLGHDGVTHGVAFGREGRLLASGGADGVMRLWDLERGGMVRSYHGHRGRIFNVAFSPDGDRLYSGGVDGVLRIWSTHAHKLLSEFKVGDARIRRFVLYPSGRRMAVALNRGGAGIWQKKDNTWAFERWQYRDKRITNPGIAVAANAGLFLATNRYAGTTLSDLHTGNTIRNLPGIWANGLAVSPDGKTVAMTLTKGRLEVRNSTDLALRHAVNLGMPGHNVAFAPNGETVWATGGDRTVRGYKTSDGFPKWRTGGLFSNPPRILTHEGGFLLRDGKKWRPKAAWARKIANDAIRSRESGKFVCAYTRGGKVSVWDTQRDQRLYSHPAERIRRLLSVGASCMALDYTQEAVLYGANGKILRKESRVRGISVDRGTYWLLKNESAEQISAAGKKIKMLTEGRDLRAMLTIGGTVIRGHRGGHVDSVFEGRRVALRDTPPLAMSMLRKGPKGTLAVGYEDGQWGLWELAQGRRLMSGHLHGPITQMLLSGDTIHVASELGQYEKRSLRHLLKDYCDILRDIWREVPYELNSDQGLVRSTAVKTHSCASDLSR